jgi:hypothetical protein
MQGRKAFQQYNKKRPAWGAGRFLLLRRGGLEHFQVLDQLPALGFGPIGAPLMAGVAVGGRAL